MPPQYKTFKFIDDDNRTYCEMELKEYLLNHVGPPLTQWKALKFVGKVQVHGVPCEQYHAFGTHDFEGDFIVNTSIGMNKDLTTALCRLCHLPEGAGLPVKLVAYRPKFPGERSTIIFEMADLKKLRLPRTTLTGLHSYKKVKDKIDMLLNEGDGKRMSIEDIFEQPMPGDKKPK